MGTIRRLAAVVTTIVVIGAWALMPVGASARHGSVDPGSAMVFSVSLDPFADPPNFDVVLLDPLDADAYQITMDAGDDWFPDLSPDHSSIVWQSDRSGKFELYRIAATTDDARTAPEQLTRTAGDGESTVPVFSPDGTKIAFVSTEGGRPHLFVMNADGSGARQVSSLLSHDGSRPSWSADGRRIAFAGARTPKDDLDIYLVDVESGKARPVGATGADEYEPAWSPDGSSILFYKGGHVWGMDAKGRDAKRLTHTGTADDSEYQPAWSPDGAHFVYVSNAPSTSALYIADANGKRPLSFIEGDFAAEAPSWR
jgi:Tol biopolymer transport system component